VAISIELDPGTERHLQKLAKRTGKAISTLLQELIARGIEDLDDLHLADGVMEKVTAGAEPIYSSD
jgi:RHH-type rel operon transcriptional repressor/antitoxin RelB